MHEDEFDTALSNMIDTISCVEDEISARALIMTTINAWCKKHDMDNVEFAEHIYFHIKRRSK